MNPDSANPSATDASEQAAGFSLVIEARRAWSRRDLIELWHARELMWILAMRDIKVRYKQTAIGVAWAVLQPLATMVVFSLLFRVLLGGDRMPTSAGVPYAVSTFCALLPWQLFATSVASSGTSLVANQNLISKVYFPRLVIPVAPVLAGLVDFAIALTILLGMMAYYRIAPGWSALLLPVFVVLAASTALGLGVWLAALNAMYRDFIYAVPFLIQFGMFVSPVVYASESVVSKMPDWMRILYGLNPMVCVLEGFRWALLGAAPPSWPMFAASCGTSLVLLLGGLAYFRRIERTLADFI